MGWIRRLEVTWREHPWRTGLLVCVPVFVTIAFVTGQREPIPTVLSGTFRALVVVAVLAAGAKARKKWDEQIEHAAGARRRQTRDDGQEIDPADD